MRASKIRAIQVLPLAAMGEHRPQAAHNMRVETMDFFKEAAVVAVTGVAMLVALAELEVAGLHSSRILPVSQVRLA